MQRGHRIAVVESDDLIRQLALRWLGDAGHLATAVTLQQLPSMAGPPTELIVANAPNPRGAAGMVRSLQAAHAVPVLLVSARFRRGQRPSTALAGQLGVSAVLPKPYTREELLAAVESALAGP